MEPIFKCPACNGRLALWAVRAQFVCPHCDMILRSNRAEALTKAVWVALAVEAVLVSFLYYLLDDFTGTLMLWGSAGGLLGYWAGWIALKRCMVFRAVARKPTTGVAA